LYYIRTGRGEIVKREKFQCHFQGSTGTPGMGVSVRSEFLGATGPGILKLMLRERNKSVSQVSASGCGSTQTGSLPAPVPVTAVTRRPRSTRWTVVLLPGPACSGPLDELITVLQDWIAHWNEDGRPFTWPGRQPDPRPDLPLPLLHLRPTQVLAVRP
jgi:hypothetical protein